MSFTWTPHRFSGGALALDVANSVILRHMPEKALHRFADPATLAAFNRAAAELCAEQDLAASLIKAATGDVAPLLALREAIDAYFRTRLSGTDDPFRLADLLDRIAGALRQEAAGPSLFTATARSALRLVADAGDGRMKICGHCGWLFLDRSKNRSRAWCDMTVCGNRVKAGRHYAARRRKNADPTADEETGR